MNEEEREAMLFERNKSVQVLDGGMSPRDYIIGDSASNQGKII